MQRKVLVAWFVMSLGAPPGFRSCHTQPGTGGADGGAAMGGADGGTATDGAGGAAATGGADGGTAMGGTGGAAATCNDDGQCAPGDFCDPTNDGGTCTPRNGQGAACTSVDQCASGFCVDGFCCDTNCSGLCQACSSAAKGAGADGACGNVVAGGDSRGQCADQGAASCGTDGTCDGNGGCQEYPSGTVCVPASCNNEGKVTFASTCDGAGTCTAGGVTGCLPYNCSGGACLTSCTSNADCAGSPQDPPFCDASGQCQQRRFPGQPCAGNDQCYTGTCNDGVCCNEGCGFTCQTCVAPGMVGMCELVPAGANNPNHPCPNGGTCDGLGSTSAYCGPCATDADCAFPTPACDVATSTCVVCNTDADCTAPAVCSNNDCRLPSGQPCAVGIQCVSGVCVSPGNTCM